MFPQTAFSVNNRPRSTKMVHTTYSTLRFSPLQLKWLHDMQLWVDRTLEEIEPDPAVKSCTRDTIDWEGHIVLQGKIDSGAPDLKIPKSALPDVMACWNARRNRLGIGKNITASLFCHGFCWPCFLRWFPGPVVWYPIEMGDAVSPGPSMAAPQK